MGWHFSTTERKEAALFVFFSFTCSLEARKVIIMDKVSDSLARNYFCRFRINGDCWLKVRGASEVSDNLLKSLLCPPPPPPPLFSEDLVKEVSL